MSHYKSNLRDIEFNLFEVLRRQDLLGQPPYPELDEETVRGILGELERMATGPLAESFADADRNPPVFDPATDRCGFPSRCASPTAPSWTPSGTGCRCPRSWAGPRRPGR